MSKIISLIIILFSFSSFSNELPTSLFGIELGEEIEQYLIDRKEFDKINKEIELGESETNYRSVCNTNEHFDTLMGKGWKREEEIQIELIRNTIFHSQCINWNENNLITSINASISYEFKDNFKQSSLNILGGNFPNQVDLKEFINFKTELETSISKLYKIDINDFKNLYLVQDFGEKIYTNLLGYFSYIDYSKNNKDYLFSSYLSIFVYKDGGGSARLTFSLGFKEADYDEELKSANYKSDSKEFDEKIEIIYDSNLLGF